MNDTLVPFTPNKLTKYILETILIWHILVLILQEHRIFNVNNII